MLRIVDGAFERPVRSVGAIADEAGVSYAGAAKSVAKLVAAGVAEEVADTYPKLIRFPEVIARLQVEG